MQESFFFSFFFQMQFVENKTFDKLIIKNLKQFLSLNKLNRNKKVTLNWKIAHINLKRNWTELFKTCFKNDMSVIYTGKSPFKNNAFLIRCRQNYVMKTRSTILVKCRSLPIYVIFTNRCNIPNYQNLFYCSLVTSFT